MMTAREAVKNTTTVKKGPIGYSNELDDPKKYRKRRILGVVLLASGILCSAVSFITETDYYIIPLKNPPYFHSFYVTDTPYQFMIVPGIVLITAGFILSVHSSLRLKRIKKMSKPTSSQSSISIQSNASEKCETPIVQTTRSSVEVGGKFCRFCGDYLSNGIFFCEGCGRKLN